eukprot:3868178-Alexandrium_andersonii.AAC.1
MGFDTCVTQQPMGDNHLWVHRRPGAHDEFTDFVLAVAGGCVCDLPFLTSNGTSGTCIKYKAGVATPRAVWASTAWKNGNPQLARAFQDALALRRS